MPVTQVAYERAIGWNLSHFHGPGLTYSCHVPIAQARGNCEVAEFPDCDSNRTVRKYNREGERVPPQAKAAIETQQTRVPLGSRARRWQYGTVYIGSRLAVVKDLKKELGPGLLADMCKQLGIRKEDL